MILESDIYSALKAEIAATATGEKLSTVRELMVRFNTTQFAVQSALKKLKEEGSIQTKVGKGTFVTGSANSQNATDLISSQAPSVLLVTHVMKSGRGEDVAAAIYDNLVQAGCAVVAISYNDIKSLNSVLGDNRFDLCLIQPRRSVLSVGLLAALKKSAKHVIVEGRNIEQADVDILYRDRFSSVQLAFEHLKSLGHNNIGLISEKGSPAVGYQEVKRIFQLYCSAASTSEMIIECQCSGDEQPPGNEQLSNALQTARQQPSQFPSAFIVSGHFSGAELQHAFSQVSLDIPQDVSIIRLRETDDLAINGGYFSSVARSSEHIAKAIHELFEWRLRNPSQAPITYLDQPKLVVRKSTIPHKVK